MAILPPTPGRLGQFPQFAGTLTSIADYFSRLKAFSAGRMVWDYPSSAAALSGMASDGAAPSRVFTVAGDPGIWTTTNGVATAIRPGARIAAGVLGYVIPAGVVGTEAWSPTYTVPLGDQLGGAIPSFVGFTTLDEGGGALTIRPTLLTSGSGSIPDLSAERFRTRASGTGATVSYTRYAAWFAITIGD